MIIPRGPSIPDRPSSPAGLFDRFVKNFVTGAMVLLPLGVIGFLAWSAYSLVKTSVLPVAEKLLGPEGHVLLPLLAIVLLLAVIVLVGLLANGPVGHRMTQAMNQAISRIPVMGPMIAAVRQVAATVLNKTDRNLQQTCMIEFPKAGTWCLGLVSADPRGEIAARLPSGEDMLAVYVGLPPFTSAFLVFVPRKDVIVLKMAADDAVRLLATAGIAYPADA